MDSKELCQLAREIKESMLELGLTKAELVMLTALVSEMVKGGDERQEAPKSKFVLRRGEELRDEEGEDVEEEGEAPKEANKVKPRSIQYDPLYDPPPPMSGDTPPPLPISFGTLAPKGRACVCESCSAAVYRTVQQIEDGMKVNEFIKAYEPILEGVEPLSRNTEIENIAGVIRTDCPKCGARKKLRLT